MDKPAIEGGNPIRKEFLPLARPVIDDVEINNVLTVIKSGWLTTGPKTMEFEKKFREFIGSKYAVAVNSCTAALHLSLIGCGVKEGDEIITTTNTFCSSANVIVWERAKPVLVDIEEGTYNIDVSKIEEKITKRTKAIMPVHYGGQPCDMDPIIELAEKYELKVIEDSAHSVGSEYKGRKIGTIGDTTCFSFYATKNLTTGEGGMLVTDDEKIAETAMLLRLHGIDKDAWKRYSAQGSWYYEVKRAGYKYNMTDVQAAIGLGQLEKIKKFNERRQEIAKIYDGAFGKIPEVITPLKKKDRVHVYHLYPIRIDTEALKIDRARFIEALKAENIGTSVHFIPLHLHPFYQRTFGYKADDFPVAQKVYQGMISIPMFPAMTDRDTGDVVSAIERLVEFYKK
jgi:dTDP-4-amino-4,6-dideoxygalactose transaminase